MVLGYGMTKREGGGSLPQELSQSLAAIVAEAKATVDSEEDLSGPEDGVENSSVHRGRRVDMEEACELLDPYIRHAEAGASDRWLAVQTQLPQTTVASWRRHRGVDRRSYEREHGLARSRLGALDLFRDDDSEDFGIQLAEASPVLGQWRPPDIMLRQPLDYDSLARFLHFLNAELPASPAQLATAFGFQKQDIEMAIELHRRRLQEIGRLCKRCGVPTEDKYCSARCARRSR